MKLEGPFEAAALRILREIPRITATPQPGRANRGGDATLRFAGTRRRITVELKGRVNAASAWQLAREAKARPNRPLLLIAGETTAEARRILDEHGVALVDGLGNAHIELPGLLFHLEGRKRPQRLNTGKPPTRLRGKAGLAAQALLLDLDHRWHVRDLAERAEVSAGLAHRVLARLEDEGIMGAEGAGPKRVRRLRNAKALLDLWAEENEERPTRTLGYLLAPTPKQLVSDLGRNLDLGGIDYALTGAAAASLVAPFVTAIPVAEVWVAAVAEPEQLYDTANADPVTDGQNVVFLQAKDDAPLAFREKADGLWMANRFRLYADLLNDPRRGREQADHLRREVIGF
ncbi:MAG: hypothetical protein ACREA0_02470 [bacterium]